MLQQVCVSQTTSCESQLSVSTIDSEGPRQVVRFTQKMLYPPSQPICPKVNLGSGTNPGSRQFRGKCPTPIESVGKAGISTQVD